MLKALATGSRKDIVLVALTISLKLRLSELDEDLVLNLSNKLIAIVRVLIPIQMTNSVICS